MREKPAVPTSARLTATGTKRFVTVPSPSSPSVLRPQQNAAPLDANPQLCSFPSEILNKVPVRVETTATGASRCVVVPSPTVPFELAPQHTLPQAGIRAQVPPLFNVSVVDWAAEGAIQHSRSHTAQSPPENRDQQRVGRAPQVRLVGSGGGCEEGEHGRRLRESATGVGDRGMMGDAVGGRANWLQAAAATLLETKTHDAVILSVGLNRRES